MSQPTPSPGTQSPGTPRVPAKKNTRPPSPHEASKSLRPSQSLPLVTPPLTPLSPPQIVNIAEPAAVDRIIAGLPEAEIPNAFGKLIIPVFAAKPDGTLGVDASAFLAELTKLFGALPPQISQAIGEGVKDLSEIHRNLSALPSQIPPVEPIARYLMPSLDLCQSIVSSANTGTVTTAQFKTLADNFASNAYNADIITMLGLFYNAGDGNLKKVIEESLLNGHLFGAIYSLSLFADDSNTIFLVKDLAGKFNGLPMTLQTRILQKFILSEVIGNKDNEPEGFMQKTMAAFESSGMSAQACQDVIREDINFILQLLDKIKDDSSPDAEDLKLAALGYLAVIGKLVVEYATFPETPNFALNLALNIDPEIPMSVALLSTVTGNKDFESLTDIGFEIEQMAPGTEEEESGLNYQALASHFQTWINDGLHEARTPEQTIFWRALPKMEGRADQVAASKEHLFSMWQYITLSYIQAAEQGQLASASATPELREEELVQEVTSRSQTPPSPSLPIGSEPHPSRLAPPTPSKPRVPLPPPSQPRENEIDKVRKGLKPVVKPFPSYSPPPQQSAEEAPQPLGAPFGAPLRPVPMPPSVSVTTTGSSLVIGASSSLQAPASAPNFFRSHLRHHVHRSDLQPTAPSPSASEEGLPLLRVLSDSDLDALPTPAVPREGLDLSTKRRIKELLSVQGFQLPRNANPAQLLESQRRERQRIEARAREESQAVLFDDNDDEQMPPPSLPRSTLQSGSPSAVPFPPLSESEVPSVPPDFTLKKGGVKQLEGRVAQLKARLEGRSSSSPLGTPSSPLPPPPPPPKQLPADQTFTMKRRRPKRERVIPSIQSIFPDPGVTSATTGVPLDSLPSAEPPKQ